MSRLAAAIAASLLVLASPWGAAPLLAGKPLPSADPAPAVVGEARGITVEPNLDQATEAGDHRLWTHLVQVDGAAFLKPHFVNLNLQRGDVLTVRSASGKVVEEIRGRGPKSAGSFWGLSAFGDTLELELRFNGDYTRQPFTIDQMILGDPEMLDLAPVLGPESICTPADFEDVACYDGDPGKWGNVLASVGVMSVGGNPVTALFCSGANVSPQNYVLTNFHCIGSSSGCDGAEFVFKYYRTGCNNGAPTTVDWESFRCDEMVASSPFNGFCDPNLDNLDFSLHSVIGDPASTFGWVDVDPNPITSGEDIYIVQHPAGRPHEITHGGEEDVVVDGVTFRYYDTLDTEGGSSGSPIFREADDKLVGLHHCGGCSTPANGNRGMLMSDIYPAIQDFLCTPALELAGVGFEGLAEVEGNGDAVLEPGETWQLVPVIRNSSCAVEALDVTAELEVNSSSTMPVTILDTQATFGAVAAGQAVAAASPVRFRLEAGAPCSDAVILDLLNLSASNGGPYPDQPAYVSLPVGDTPVATVLFEDVSTGLPASWAVVDGGTGTGIAATWTDTNPGGRGVLTAPFMIADSDELGSGGIMDEELISPAVDTSGYATVTLQFSHDFNHFTGGQDEQGDVDVRSSATGGAWVNLVNFSGADASGMVTLDLTPYAAADLQIRFHYYQASFEWWWAVDDIYILGDNGVSCSILGTFFADDFEAGDLQLWSQQVP